MSIYGMRGAGKDETMIRTKAGIGMGTGVKRIKKKKNGEEQR